ncbi:MAG: HAMP domain-containing protein [Thiogranum sp.]|nr:HAMP domain-containing protein [Thiogranum sp.]
MFIISLVLVVLHSVAIAGFFLVRDHVATSITEDLDRAEHVFAQAQTSRFDNLLTVARSVRDEPSLIAAALTGDIATVRGMLEDLYPRPGADFIAVYLDTGPGGVAGAGSKPHYTSPQILGSDELLTLVRSLANGSAISFGNSLMYDSWLQMVAVPSENPLGGRVGALIVGKRFSEKDLNGLRQLVYADLAIFSGNLLLASSIDNLQPPLLRFDYDASDGSNETLDVDGERYGVRALPIRTRIGSDANAAHVLLAAKYAKYWLPYKQLGTTALYFSLLILLLAALFGISISRRSLTRPIQLLARATQAIADGDMTHKVSLDRNDELGQLTTSFNAMLSALGTSQSELRQSQKRFKYA